MVWQQHRTTAALRNAILKRGAMKHIILILYTVDHSLTPRAATGNCRQCCAAWCQLHKFKSLCECHSDAHTKALDSVCLWFKAKPLLRNLLAHLMRPWQKERRGGNQTFLLFYILFWVCSLLPTCTIVKDWVACKWPALFASSTVL